MTLNASHARRFRRIKLNATIILTNTAQQSLLCQCSDFSEDGIDVEPPAQPSLFTEFNVKAGDIVQVQIDQLNDAPELSAAVIKLSPNRIGLRFLPEQP